MTDGLHPLLKRGVDASTTGPRVGQKPRRFVGDGLGKLGPSGAGNFFARRPQREIADSVAGKMVLDPQAMRPPTSGERMREQTRIPLYERPSRPEIYSPGSAINHPLFAPPPEWHTNDEEDDEVQTNAAPANPVQQRLGEPASFDSSFWQSPLHESPAAESRSPEPKSLGLWQDGDPEPGAEPESESSSGTIDPALIGSVGNDSYRDLRRPISLTSEDRADLGGDPTRPAKYAWKGHAFHYLDRPEVTAAPPERPKAKKRSFFQKLRSLFTGRGWR